MEIMNDLEVNALSVCFLETTVTIHYIAEGIAVDYNSKGKIVVLKFLM